MAQNITRHPLKVDRMPIVNGEFHIGGQLPQTFREWFSQEFGAIHTVTLNNQPWFVGMGIARVLGYVKPENALKMHVKSKYKCMFTKPKMKKMLQSSEHPILGGMFSPFSLGGAQRVTLISLSGLISLISHSRMPKAEEFQDWVYGEVIPSIYQTGAYITDERMAQIDNNPQEMEKLVEEVKQLKPLAHYAQTTLKSDEALTFTVVAKEFGWTSQQLHKFLEQQKVIFTRNKRKQTKVWQPHKKYANSGLFTFQTYTYSDKKDKVHSSTTLYITQKGRLEIHKIMLHHGFKPLAA